MKERQPMPRPQGEPAGHGQEPGSPAVGPAPESALEPEGWDVEGVSRALGRRPEPHKDLYVGEGYRLVVPELDAHVELYPERQLARFSHPGVYLEMNNARMEVDDTVRLVTETDKCRTVVTLFKPEGAVIFSGSKEAPPALQAEVQHPADTPEQALSEERERITLLGRVGATPSFRTTPKGTLVGRFPLAVHEADNKTSWHTVMAFGDRAQKLRHSLAKGQQVEVVAYRHVRQAKDREGKPKLVEELYAVVVKLR